MKGFAATLAAEAEKYVNLLELQNKSSGKRSHIYVCDPTFACDRAELLKLTKTHALVCLETWQQGQTLTAASFLLCQQPRVCLWLARAPYLSEPLLRFMLLRFLRNESRPLSSLFPWGQLQKTWAWSATVPAAPEFSYLRRLGLPAALCQGLAQFRLVVASLVGKGSKPLAGLHLSHCQVLSDGTLLMYVLRIHVRQAYRELAASLFATLIAKDQRSVIVNILGPNCIEVAQLVPLCKLTRSNSATLGVQEGAFFIST